MERYTHLWTNARIEPGYNNMMSVVNLVMPDLQVNFSSIRCLEVDC